MTKHDEARRTFLVRAAVGAGAIAGAGLMPATPAQGQEQGEEAEASARPLSSGQGHGAFFNRDQAATIAAFTERLMPGAPGSPGASDAEVLNYIDLALAGAYANLQNFYRRGLTQLDAYCRKTYNEPFVRLDAARQDEVITALEGGKATGFTWPAAQEFFQHRPHAYDGRHVRRPDLWWQQGLCRLASGGLSRHTSGFHAGGHGKQTSIHAGAYGRPAGASQRPVAGGLSHGNRKDRCRHRRSGGGGAEFWRPSWAKRA